MTTDPQIYCDDCGSECNARAPRGPATVDTAGVTRCRECHLIWAALVGALTPRTRAEVDAIRAALAISQGGLSRDRSEIIRSIMERVDRRPPPAMPSPPGPDRPLVIIAHVATASHPRVARLVVSRDNDGPHVEIEVKRTDALGGESWQTPPERWDWDRSLRAELLAELVLRLVERGEFGAIAAVANAVVSDGREINAIDLGKLKRGE